jgi:hypothetical protein
VAELELEVARLRTIKLEATSSEDRNSRTEPLTPPYIARAVIAVEGHLSDMERFAATGNEIAAQESRVAAASRCCSALRRLCDDDDFLQILVSMGNLISERESEDGIPNATTRRMADTNDEPTISDQINAVLSDERFRYGSFRELEIQLLQISGLPEILAEAHIDAAHKAYYRNPDSAIERLQNPMTFLSNLRALREASCLSADFLSESLRNRKARQRWKKLLTFGLSGTLIVAANSAGTAILGPVGVAASAAIGSAAVGVAAQFVS